MWASTARRKAPPGNLEAPRIVLTTARPRSQRAIPVFIPYRRHSGSGPESRPPGLLYRIPVEPGMTTPKGDFHNHAATAGISEITSRVKLFIYLKDKKPLSKTAFSLPAR